MATLILRKLQQAYIAQPVNDGDGVRIQRSIAGGNLQSFDPFLMLDEIASDNAADYMGGFPEHPHRGFETVTYMLEGSMEHRDHMGNTGLLQSGGVQWMTAGRGVLHSEMPKQNQGRLHGFQIWINLPAAEKMCEPRYLEYNRDQIPSLQFGALSKAKVIAGCLRSNGDEVHGVIQQPFTAADYADIHIGGGDTITIETDTHKQVLLYVYQGAIQIENNNLRSQQLGRLSSGNLMQLSCKTDSRLLLLAGNPLGEPIAHWWPFVMNTREQVEQAITD